MVAFSSKDAKPLDRKRNEKSEKLKQPIEEDIGGTEEFQLVKTLIKRKKKSPHHLKKLLNQPKRSLP